MNTHDDGPAHGMQCRAIAGYSLVVLLVVVPGTVMLVIAGAIMLWAVRAVTKLAVVCWLVEWQTRS